MTKKDTRESQNIVVIGGGPSAAACVETLRQEGYAGQISLVCKENCLPYNRVLVSKTMDFELEKGEFRTDKFYKDNGIDVLKGIEATSVSTSQKSVTLSNGRNLNYDRLFIATGLKANKVDIPGADLKNVMVLRDYAHSQETFALLNENAELVVLGSSFVAMEAASFCANKVKKVTVVARGTVPFKPLVGERVGAAWKKLCESQGINFVVNSGMKRCIDDGTGKVGKVELIDGTELTADIVIMGVGSSCYTEFLQHSGINVSSDGSVEVDEYLQTNVPEVYVGGDIAHAPVWSHYNQKFTIGHYGLAHYHGKVAALNMLGRKTKLQAVPYFWTRLFNKSLRYAGHGKFDDILYIGDVEALKFVAYYLNGDEVVAIADTGMEPVVSNFAELLAQGKKLYRKDVEGDDKFQWSERLHSDT